MEKKCCFTGHRPKSLPFGYNEEEPSCKKLKELLSENIERQITENGVTHFISGMAMGVDIYEWPEYEDKFTVVGDDHEFTGNYSIERAKILATVFALSAYNTAASPVEKIKDGEVYSNDVTFTVAYNYRDHVTVDGKAVTVDADGKYKIAADNAEHTVAVTDIFGNTFSYNIKVYKTYTVTFIADGQISSAESCASSPAVNAKSNRSKFSRMCSGFVLLGITAMPFCIRNRSSTCAGVLPYFLASASTLGSANISFRPPCPSGA